MSNHTNYLYKLLNIVWLLLVIYVAYLVYVNAVPVWGKIGTIKYEYIILGTISGLLFTIPSVWILNDYLRKYHLEKGPVIAAFLMFVPAIGKYIPGKVWSTGSFMIHAKKLAGIPADDVLIFVFYYQIIGVGSTLVLLLLAYIYGLESVYSIKYIAVAFLVLIAFVVLVVQLKKKIQSSRFHPGYLAISKHLFAMSLQKVLRGISLFLFVSAFIDINNIMTVIYAFIIAMQAGVLAFFAPAGLGVTEGVYIMVLSPVYGAELAIIVALVSRVWSVVLDFLLAVIGLITKRCFLPAD